MLFSYYSVIVHGFLVAATARFPDSRFGVAATARARDSRFRVAATVRSRHSQHETLSPELSGIRRRLRRTQEFPVALAFGAYVLLLDQLIVRLEEDHVAHFVTLPNYQEDETMQHETLESWLLFFGRETYAYCVGCRASHGGNWPPPGHDSTWVLRAVFMTVRDDDTHWPPSVLQSRHFRVPAFRARKTAALARFQGESTTA